MDAFWGLRKGSKAQIPSSAAKSEAKHEGHEEPSAHEGERHATPSHDEAAQILWREAQAEELCDDCHRVCKDLKPLSLELFQSLRRFFSIFQEATDFEQKSTSFREFAELFISKFEEKDSESEAAISTPYYPLDMTVATAKLFAALSQKCIYILTFQPESLIRISQFDLLRLKTVVLCVQTLNIMAKKPTNRAILHHHKILDTIIPIYTAAIGALGQLSSKQITTPPPPYLIQMLNTVSTSCLSLLGYLSDPCFSWRRKIYLSTVYGDRFVDVLSLHPEEVGEAVLKHSPHKLDQSVVLTLIETLFDHLRILSKTSAGVGPGSSWNQSASPYLEFIISLLGVFLSTLRNPHHTLTQFGRYLGLLKDLIGWPNPSLRNDPVSLQTHYKNQVACLQLLCILLTTPSNVIEFTSSGGFDKCIDLLLWVSYDFSGVQSDSADVSEFRIQCRAAAEIRRKFLKVYPSSAVEPLPAPRIPQELYPTQELLVVFDIFLFLMISHWSSMESHGVGKNPFLTVLMDLFNAEIRNTDMNRAARLKIRTEVPNIQLMLISGIIRFLSKSPPEILRDGPSMYMRLFEDSSRSMYDVFLGEYFYFAQDLLQQHGETSIIIRRRFGLLKSLILDLIKFIGTHSRMDPEELEKHLERGFKEAAHVTGHVNVNECKAVLTAIQLNYKSLNLTMEFGECLVAMLRHNLLQSQNSLESLDALPLLCTIIRFHALVENRYSLAKDQENSTVKLPPWPYAEFKACRYVILEIFDLFLSNPDVQKSSVRKQHVIDILLSLIYEEDLRPFALHHLMGLMRSAPIKSAQTTHLFTKYIDLLIKPPSFIEEMKPSREIQRELAQPIIIELLEGIKAVVQTIPDHKKTFRKVDCFTKIMSLGCNESSPQLCAGILGTLTALLSNSQKNKIHMRDLVGYDSVKELIFRSEEQKPSKKTMLLLFDMLVEGSFDIEMKFTFQNPDVIILMFDMLLDFSPDLQLFFLEQFVDCVRKSSLNCAQCCGIGLISTILTWIPKISDDHQLELLIGLVGTLGSHSINVREIKMLFALLKSRPGDYRPRYMPYMLKAIEAMSQKDGPDSFLEFDGKSSAMQIPEFKHFPRSRGYTFVTWVRIESFRDPMEEPNYEPRLLSFLNDQGQGVELFFRMGQLHLWIGGKNDYGVLVLENANLAKKSAVELLGYMPIQENRWHCIQVTHSASKSPFSQSEVRLYIDGALHFASPFKYPTFTSPLTKCYVGCNHKIDSKNFFRLRHNSLFGQIASIYFFSDVLTVAQIQAVYRLGCNYFSDFSRVDIADLELGVSYSAVADAFDDNVRNSLSFGFCGKSRDEHACIDLSQHGYRGILRNTSACVTQSLKDVIYCIGGIQILLPLIAQLDQPTEPKPEKQGNAGISSSTSHLNAILTVLLEMIRNHTTNRREFQNQQGFSMIAYLLKHISPEHISIDTVNIIFDIEKILTIGEFWIELVRNLMLDFDIWTYTSSEVQLHFLARLGAFYRDHQKELKDIIHIQVVLDILRGYYWYESDQGSFCLDVKVHPKTGMMQGSRPHIDDMRIIREKVMTVLLRPILCPESSYGMFDSESIAYFISDCKDQEQLRELLEFLLKSHASFHPDVMRSLVNQQNWTIVPSLIQNTTGHVHRLLVELCCLLKGTALPSRRKSRADLEYSMWYVSDFFRETQMTQEIYFSLRNWYFGLTQQFQNQRLSTTDASGISINEFPAYGSMLYALKLADPGTKQLALREFYLLLKMKYDNIVALKDIPGWHFAIIRLLSDSAAHDSKYESINGLVLEIAAFYVLNVICIEAEAWKYFEAMLSMILSIDHLSKQTKLGIICQFVNRVLFSISKRLDNIKFMEDLAEGSPIFDDPQSKASIFHANVASIVNLVDQYFFTIWFVSWCKDTTQNVHMKDSFNPDTFKPITWEEFLNSRHLLTPIGLGQAITYMLEITEHKTLKSTLDKFEFSRGSLSEVRMCLCVSYITSGSESAYSTQLYERLVAAFQKEFTSEKRIEFGPKLHPTTKYITQLIFAYFLKITGEPELSNSSQLEFLARCIISCSRMIRASKTSLKDTMNAFELPPGSTSYHKELSSWITESKRGEIKSALSEELRLMSTEISSLTKPWCDKILNAYKFHVERFDTIDQNALSGIRRCLADSKAKLAVIQQQECKRIQGLVDQSKDRSKSLKKLWHRVLRKLASERGPWGNKYETVHWKLDKTEDSCRRRIKMKRNYHFDSHADARHTAWKPEDEMKAQRSTPENVFQKSLSGIHFTWTDYSNSQYLDEVAPIMESEQSKFSYSTACDMIVPLSTIPGKLELTQAAIHFVPDDLISYPNKEFHWSLDSIIEVYSRRYLLRRSAIELFFDRRTSAMFNFPSFEVLQTIRSRLSAFRSSIVIDENAALAKWTQKWQKRAISNFEYLMRLNTLAGRSYNDLTQYPVFPWVLKNYESATIDLTDSENYRDLTKPMGAQNSERLQYFLSRFDGFQDLEIPKFHYGSHYSSSGIVLYYLIRVEPYTTLFLQLQGGKFDHADRLFFSIGQSWDNAITQTCDVKELIPEFFYLPEMFVNENQFDYGRRQTGTHVNDVILPPWASSPEEFVRIHREALESDYVSDNLHHWINLIFGFKQHGPEAEKAHNVFYFLTYENAVDITKITNPLQRKAVESQIENFGQTPSRLFTKPHVARLPATEDLVRKSIFDEMVEVRRLGLPRTLGSPIEVDDRFRTSIHPYSLEINPKEPIVFLDYDLTTQASLLFSFGPESVIAITENRSVIAHTLSPGMTNPQAPFHIAPERLHERIGSNKISSMGKPFSHGTQINSNCYAMILDSRIVSCGYWDNTAKIHDMKTLKLLQELKGHKGVVTCLAVTRDRRIFATGSTDTTIRIWEVSLESGRGTVSTKQTNTTHATHKAILYGHDDEVKCIAIDVELDVVVSGSKDGSIIIHTLRHGQYVRSIYTESLLPIDRVAVSSAGYFAYVQVSDIFVHSINARQIYTFSTPDRVNALEVSPNGEYLVTGGERGVITVRYIIPYMTSIYGTREIARYTVEKSISCLRISVSSQYIYAGTSDGHLIVIAAFRPLPANYAHSRIAASPDIFDSRM
eukprot:TRINITY_DN7961_c0_g2_i1.p1 TRINITY_DN7961_c0_g2~~TRINITY_DN7961_c0_g2_i1.p1  ORF type:complete len:3076 (+),score=468.11 TRINITY_DN7961_c0_g2_i1:50-9277(+)